MFDKKIKDILREILTLKNLKNKSAMTIKTIEKPFSVSFEITGAGTEYYSDKIAVVKMTNGGLPPIAQVYFDVVDFDYRQLSVHKVIDTNGDLNFYICIDYDQNPTDISEIQQGHQVIVNYNCKIVSTADNEITIEYIQNEAPAPPVPDGLLSIQEEQQPAEEDVSEEQEEEQEDE